MRVFFVKHRTKLLLSSSLIFSMSYIPASSAQQSSIPPTAETIDERGVDLTSGFFVPPFSKISIGDQDEGLGVVFSFHDMFWRNDFQSFLQVSGSNADVSLGRFSKKFTMLNGIWVSDSRDGSSFLYDSTISSYKYIDRDGVIIVFEPTLTPNGWYNISKIIEPSGKQTIFTYKRSNYVVGAITTTYDRLQSVTRNDGYQLKLNYQSDNIADSVPNWKRLIKITAINNAVDSCYPLDTDVCSNLTQSWPSLIISDPGVGQSPTPPSVTDSLGRTTTYQYDASNYLSVRIISVQRPGSSNPNTTITYAPDKRVSSVTSDGRTWGYNFTNTVDGVQAVITNPGGSTRTILSKAPINKITSVTDELNRTTTFQYDTYGRLTETTYPSGKKTRFAYDGRGNIVEQREVSSTPGTPPDIVTSFDYDITCTSPSKCNKPNFMIDPKGNRTDYTYDPVHGGILTFTPPAPVAASTRPQTRYFYGTDQAYYKNNLGNIVASGQNIYQLAGTSSCQTLSICAATSDEVKSSISYGTQSSGSPNNLLPTSILSGSGNGALTASIGYGYDTVGNLTTIDGPLPGPGDITRLRYDAARQKVGEIGPDPDGGGARIPRAQRWTYDTDGLVSQFELGTVVDQTDSAWMGFSSQSQMTATRDAGGRVIKKELKSGGATYQLTQTSYDTRGRVECVAERMDPVQWDAQTSACIPQTSGSNGPDRIEKTVYDSASQVTEVRVATGVSGVQASSFYTYTANGMVASVEDGGSHLTTYDYDGFDRLSKTRYPSALTTGSSSTNDYDQIIYDPNSNVTSRRLRGYAADNNQHIDYVYDNLNRVITKDTPDTGSDVSYTYDLLNRSTSASNSSQSLNFTYDALGRKVSESSPVGTVSSQYDLAGRRTSLIWPDGFYVNYDYLVTGQVTAVRENGAVSGPGVLAIYNYDDMGRRTFVIRGNGTVSNYSFNGISLLSSLGHDLLGSNSDVNLSFSYNSAGQITGRARSNDAYGYGYTTNTNLNYTINGLNQVTAVGGGGIAYDSRGNLSSTGANTYSYSSENLLRNGPSGNTLSYDPILRLSQINSAARFGYADQYIIGEYTASNLLIKRYVYGPGIDEPLVWYEGSDTSDRRWLHADERGSIIAVTNGSGTAIGINSYDEYGVPANTNIGRFQYTGQAWLPEFGLYYYKARIYSSRLGRFMQTDPIGYADGLNWYTYANGDPINRSDPTGLQVNPCVASCVVVTAPADWLLSPTEAFTFPALANLGGLFPSQTNGFDPTGSVAPLGKGKPQKQQKTKPCDPTPAELANSGAVTFRFSEASATLLATSGDAFGTFQTAGGYSGTFHASFDGAFIGSKGLGVAYGTGTSQSLATFKGVNYNLIGTLGPYSISDNFDPNSGAHVGETNAFSRIGLGLGVTRSDTTLVTISCPR